MGDLTHISNHPASLYSIIQAMLTHCFSPGYTHEGDKWTYRCIVCDRKGLDCLRTCTDCKFLSFTEKKKSRCFTVNGNLIMRQILCKECSLYHVHYSMNSVLFNVRIFFSSNFVDYISKSSICKTIIVEQEKEAYLRDSSLTYTDPLRCTYCRIKYPRKNRCHDCDDLNEINMKEKRRLSITNGHLIITDYLCLHHSQFYYHDFEF